jgi:type VI secretion system protein ImpE
VTPHEALAEGRLAEALALQEGIVAAEPHNPAARRFLVDLLAFAGRLDDVADHLAHIRVDDAQWSEVARELRELVHAEKARSVEGCEPRFVPRVEHAVERWRAIESLRSAKPEEAMARIDRADAVSPHVRGFLDGQEFEGLHDADDRFASVLEAFRGGEYVWFAWESVRKVTLAPAHVLLDQLYRPATISLKNGEEFATHLPLIYPDSHRADGFFALGTETDHICPDRGPMRCIGGKLLLVGDGVEVPLAACRMIEIR